MFTRTPTTLVAGLVALSLAVIAPAGQARAQQPGAQKQTSATKPTRAEQGAMENQQQTARARREAGSVRQDPNAMLEDRVFVRLAERAWAGADFKVTARDGLVTIDGTVPDEQSRQRILRIARRTLGVLEVRDQLTVDPASGARAAGPAGPTRDLSKRVAEHIAGVIGAKAGEDWWLTGWRVEGPSNTWSFVVEADEGRINLEGDVPRFALIRKAVEAALNVSGVRSVRSDLAVEPAYPYYVYDYHPHRYGYGHYPYGHVPDAWNPYRPGPSPGFWPHPLPFPAERAESLYATTGEVAAVDRDAGTVTLDTSMGDMTLRVPSTMLEELDRGERVGVEIRQLGASPAGG